MNGLCARGVRWVLTEAVKELEPLAKAPGQKVLWAAVDLKLGYKQVEAALTPVIEESGQPVDVGRAAR